MNHLAVYAHRFNRRVTIERPLPPQPTPADLTDEEFERFISGLHPLSQPWARFTRAMSQPREVGR